jgi:arginyl-tRNA synthetase
VITEHLEELLAAALAAARRDGAVPPGEAAIELERPKRKEHGDWATNLALKLASGGADPRRIAQALVERLPASELVASVELAGPGFLNFKLAPAWLHDVVRRAATDEGFGRSALGAGTRVNVEYVSANPTGPLSVVGGRHAAYGDALANLLEATGHEVTREFYINDAGRQVRLFGESVAARYLQLHGRPAELPEDGYEGDYVIDLARSLAAQHGDRYVDVDPDERVRVFTELAVEAMVAQMRASLERFGTSYDLWFSEHSLHDRGEVAAAVDKLRAAGVVEERDGALWLLSSRYGDDRDRVIVRANGEPTYLGADCAYLVDKFARGFDHLIYVWGADHHGTVPRLLAAADALGFGRERVEVLLVQIVTLLTEGGALKGSKRKGVIVTLDELIDEVGRDAARYTFLSRSIDAPLEFDIAAVKRQAPDNPVYYVQYAHARICSVLRKAGEQGLEADVTGAPLELLTHPSEDELMRKLAAFEETVPEAAELRAPQRITRYAEELATVFSAFYRDCRVVSEDRALSVARLTLCEAARKTIARALGLLGVSAPERM